MTTDWAHLLNAKYIDQVLASTKAHPEKWHVAWDSSILWGMWHVAWNAARALAGDSDYIGQEGLTRAWVLAGDYGHGGAKDAILALVAYDDCAYMLESEVGELKILAAFGDHRAILLLPACIAFNSIKEMEMV